MPGIEVISGNDVMPVGEGDVVIIGRGAACDVQVSDPRVSREHAELRKVAGHWTLSDKSSGGTWHRGQPVRDIVVNKELILRLGTDGGPDIILRPLSPGPRDETVFASASEISAALKTKAPTEGVAPRVIRRPSSAGAPPRVSAPWDKPQETASVRGPNFAAVEGGDNPSLIESGQLPLVLGLAAVVIFIGSFGPWAKVVSVFGTVSIAGTDGDGVLTLVLGIAGMLGAWQAHLGRRLGLHVLLIVGGLSLSIAGYTLTNVYLVEAEDAAFVGAGFGLWMVFLAAMAAFGVALAALMAPKPTS